MYPLKDDERVKIARQIKNLLVPGLYEFPDADKMDIDIRCTIIPEPIKVELLLSFGPVTMEGGHVLLVDDEFKREDAVKLAHERMLKLKKAAQLWSATRK